MLYMLLWRDIVEILFYSCIIYSFSCWLKADKTKNLLGYFLLYCILTLVTWSLELPTTTHLLFSFAPTALLLFIVLHEKTLQRNFVALRNITPAKKESDDWFDILLSSSLSLLNNNKNATIIIEHNDSLEQFLTTPFFFNANLSKGILEVVLSSASYDQEKMIWINSHGYLCGINVSWLSDNHTYQDVFFYSMNTDAIILNIDPTTRLCSVIMQEKEYNNIPVHQARSLIRKQLSQLPEKTKGVYRENVVSQKSHSKQCPP